MPWPGSLSPDEPRGRGKGASRGLAAQADVVIDVCRREWEEARRESAGVGEQAELAAAEAAEGLAGQGSRADRAETRLERDRLLAERHRRDWVHRSRG